MEVFCYIGVLGFFFGVALLAITLKGAELISENSRLREENEALMKDNLQFARNNEALRELLPK